jgi:hypothetical protein
MGKQRPRARKVFSPKPEIPYLTPGERSLFKLQREGNTLSFFRTKKCDRDGCTEETLKHKRTCSKRCWKILNGEPPDSISVQVESEDDE